MEPRIYEREGQWWAEYSRAQHIHRLGPFAGRHTARDVLAQKLALMPKLPSEPKAQTPRKRRKRPPLPEGIPAAICMGLGKREQRLGLRGVFAQGGGYIVRFMHQNSYRHFGWYKTKEEAAAVYDEQIVRLRGPNAPINGLNVKSSAVHDDFACA